MLSRLFNKKPTAKGNAIQTYEPSPRWGAIIAASADELFIYGGRIKNFMKTSGQLAKVMQMFNFSVEAWTEIPTTGSPPQGLYIGTAAYSDHFTYAYGGTDGTSWQASLHELDTKTFIWTKLSSQCRNGPLGKSGCGMIYFNNCLLLCGGYGISMGRIQQGSRFIENDSCADGRGWTNEIHMFNIREGTWLSPRITGQRPPPCVLFSLTKISLSKAIFFGGSCRGVKFNHLFIVDLTTLKFTKVSFRDGDPLPTARSSHSAVCLGYGSDNPELLIHGGLDSGMKPLNDFWCFSMNSRRWKKTFILDMQHIQPRFDHSASVFNITPEIVEVLLFGGCPEWPKKWKNDGDHIPLSDTTMLRFELQDSSSGGKSWFLTNIAYKSQLGSPERLAEKKRLIQSFYARKGEDSDSNMRILQQHLQEARARAEESQRRAQEADNRAQESNKRAQEADDRAQEAEKRAQEVSQKKGTSKAAAEKVDVLDKEGFLSIGEATTTYTGEATDIKHDNLGIQLHLPDQDLPPDVTECPVSVSVAVSGEFDLPGKSEAVSGVYKIDSPLVAQKPVTIRMQHCVAEDGIGNLSFASSTDTAPPFVYKYIDGGKFTSTHGEIEIDEFCFYTILEKHGREGLLSLYQKKYHVSLHCSKTPIIERPTCLSWSLFFTIVKNCSIFQRSVDRYFLECDAEVERLTDVIVKFDEDSQDVVLALEGDRVEIQPGWSIISLATCSIKKNEVDNYADGRPPLFRLILMQNRDQNPTDLFQKFMLKGVEDSECYINIFKPVSKEGNIMGPTHKAQYKRYYEKINKSKKSVLCSEIEDDGHLNQIAKVLQDWQEKYHLLGLKLNPDVNDIRDKYREKPELQRQEVLHLWRNKSVDPTYENLLKICAQAGWRDSARVIVQIINEAKILE